MVQRWFNGIFMGFHGIDPLVNVYITERSTIFHRLYRRYRDDNLIFTGIVDGITLWSPVNHDRFTIFMAKSTRNGHISLT